MRENIKRCMAESEHKKQKNIKGITLMVLVITIIVLLILAGVTINLTFRDGGILGEARKATGEWSNATEKEETELMKLASEMAKARNGIYNGTSNAGTSEGEDTNIEITELITRIEALENKLVETEQKVENIYPVGSVYITTEISTADEVASKLGGTWEKYGQGRTLIGEGTGTDSNSTNSVFAINSQGGEYTHKLTIDEMPSHNHSYYMDLYRDTATVLGAAVQPGNTTTGPLGWGLDVSKNMFVTGARNGSMWITDTGGSKEHNTIQPYITVYMWKRVN